MEDQSWKTEAKWTATCEHCGGLLEFSASDVGKLANCCYCGKEITLFHNYPNPPKTKAAYLRKHFWAIMFVIAALTVYGFLRFIMTLDDDPSALWFGVCAICAVLFFVCSPFSQALTSGIGSHISGYPDRHQTSNLKVR